MGRVLTTEFIKLKGSPVLWVSAIGVASAPVFNGLLTVAYSSRGRAVDWPGFMNQSVVFVAVFLGAVLFGLVTAYLFGREYAEDTLKSLLTVPVRRTWVAIAKLLVLLVWSLGLALVAWAVSLLIGAAVVSDRFSWHMAGQTLEWFIVTVLLIYATLPPVAWITMLARGYIPSIGFAIVATFAGFVFLYSDKYSAWFPWTIPTRYALSVRPDNPVPAPGASSWAVMGAVFVLGVVLCLFHLQYADVDK